MYIRFFSLILGLTLLSVAACGPVAIINEEKTIENAQWAYRDTLDFRFEVLDTATVYGMKMKFAYADTFPAQNIYLRIHTQFPDGRRQSKLCSFDLFDAEGKSVGAANGHRCTATLPLQEKALFKEPGAYRITIEQYTRQEPLPGISAIGLVVSKTDAMW
jgi:gliding motility-associated lipoprotein GldH